jgi:hypothetical protein
MRFEPIAVGVDNKGRIVAGTIVGAQARRAVVAAVVFDRGGMERVHTGWRRRGEAKVRTRFRVRHDRVRCFAFPKDNAVSPIAKRSGTFAQAPVTKRFQCCIVEALGTRRVSDAYGNMIDHGLLLPAV